jgi:hypothetical protein
VPAPLAPRARLAAFVLALLVAGALPVPSPALADARAEAACRESFARVKRAFESASAESVVGCLPAEGTLQLTLLGLATRPEPMKREQAQRVLKSYFEIVSGLKLVERAGQPAESLVRAYDYTRRLRNGDPAVTRLTITLKQDAAGALKLHAIAETAR